MPKIFWLEAAVPLVKTFEQTPTGVIVTPYPQNVANFTSHEVDIKTISDFAKELSAKQKTGWCLLKGTIKKPLKNERRAGSTTTDAPTDWVCFDLDSAPFDTPQAFMEAVKLDDVSYTVQYSASHGLEGHVGLNCHIFVFLSRKLPAPQLKNWLMYLNINVKELRDGLRLSNTAITLSYPLDITTCQNDKLLFVCAPTFKKMKDPYLNGRVEFIKRENDVLNVEKIALHAPEALKKIARDILNEKRTAAQLPPLRAKTVIVGEYEVQNQPGVMTITGGPKVEREFVYFNINGGKNWSYYHPVGNYELLHNFKGEPSVRIKDALPDYYREQQAQRATANQSVSEEGDMVLAFRDKRTSTYWTGTWNPAERKLDLFQSRNETQVDHFLRSHDQPSGDFIPIWEKIFDPTSETIVDPEARTVNLFAPSPFMKSAAKIKQPSMAACPTILRIVEHAVGTGPVFEHFLNWMAVIFQYRVKTTTCWVLHGVQGTGKDTLVDRIISPVLGPQFVESRNQNELRADFTGWLEYALVAHIREIEVDALKEGGVIDSKLKNYIADLTVPIRKMRTDSYNARSFVNLVFSSNKNLPVRIPKDDRRFNVGRFQTKKLSTDLYELETLIPQELQAFADYLNSRPADKQLAAQVIQTEDRDAIMDLSMSSIDHVARYLLDGNLEGMWEAMPDEKTVSDLHGVNDFATYAGAYVGLMKRSFDDYINKRSSKFTREELGAIFEYCVGGVPHTPHKLTSFLRHQGIVTRRLRSGHGAVYGIEVSWFCSEGFVKDVLATQPKAEVKQLKRVGK